MCRIGPDHIVVLWLIEVLFGPLGDIFKLLAAISSLVMVGGFLGVRISLRRRVDRVTFEGMHTFRDLSEAIAGEARSR